MTIYDAVVDQLDFVEELISIPSVSLPGFDHAHVQASAELVRSALQRAGLDDATIVAAPGGLPSVIASRTVDPAVPTVLLYAHHDVMPADETGWTSPPFDPQLRDGRLYGRGAADDKGGLAVHLATLQHLGDALPVNVRVLVEGEEEAGSPTIGALLDTHREQLAADLAIVTDGLNNAPLSPTVGVSYRGMLDIELTIGTGTVGAHSGMWGGAAPDALLVLTRVLASLHDDRGDVAVAGLVAAPDPDGELDRSVVTGAVGLLEGVQLIGSAPTVAAQLWARPSITTIGIDAPSVAASSNRLTGRARARLNVRLAPGDETTSAWRAVRAHIAAAVPFGAHWDLTLRGSGEPFTDSGRRDVLDVAQRRLGEAFGTPCAATGCGASIPLLGELQRRMTWGTVLVTGVEDPASNPHGENESVDIETVGRAAAAEAALLADLLDLPAR